MAVQSPPVQPLFFLVLFGQLAWAEALSWRHLLRAVPERILVQGAPTSQVHSCHRPTELVAAMLVLGEVAGGGAAPHTGSPPADGQRGRRGGAQVGEPPLVWVPVTTRSEGVHKAQVHAPGERMDLPGSMRHRRLHAPLPQLGGVKGGAAGVEGGPSLGLLATHHCGLQQLADENEGALSRRWGGRLGAW